LEAHWGLGPLEQIQLGLGQQAAFQLSDSQRLRSELGSQARVLILEQAASLLKDLNSGFQTRIEHAHILSQILYLRAGNNGRFGSICGGDNRRRPTSWQPSKNNASSEEESSNSLSSSTFQRQAKRPASRRLT
jgi:hypothetical protein